MRHFIVYLIVVFAGLFGALFLRQSQDPNRDSRPVLRIYAPGSFIKQWGPGPLLKEKFEANCECRVEYHDAADSTSLIQRVKSETKNHAADLVLGFDQYDLEMAQVGFEWRSIKVDAQSIDENIRPLLSRTNFVPYDWGVLAFLAHKTELQKTPQKLDDLLDPEFASGISVQDPRTSSPGLQFLLWLIQVKGEEEGFRLLQGLAPQIKAWGANWSMSYGLFQKKQVKLVFSYVTSTVASLREDPQADVIALQFDEGHPVQYEFMGIPSTCQNCELAEKFASLVLSKDGQRIVMDKNYMFPVLKGITQGTVFENVPEFKTIDMTVIPNMSERERILKKWSQLRRSE